MNVVHMNGLTLLPGIDYTVGKHTISFSVAPPAGADIMFTEVINADSGATHVTRLHGDGTTYLFRLDTDFSTRVMLNEMCVDLLEHIDNPAVKDALDKLRVTLELVKQEDTVYYHDATLY